MTNNSTRFRANIIGAVLLATFATSPAFSANRTVEVHNKTGTTIQYLWASNIADRSYRRDLLTGPAYIITPDQTVRFDLADGSSACRFDMKVKYKNGVVHELRDFDACSVQHIDAAFDGLVVAY